MSALAPLYLFNPHFSQGTRYLSAFSLAGVDSLAATPPAFQAIPPIRARFLLSQADRDLSAMTCALPGTRRYRLVQ